jgi:hypothetical protein
MISFYHTFLTDTVKMETILHETGFLAIITCNMGHVVSYKGLTYYTIKVILILSLTIIVR